MKRNFIILAIILILILIPFLFFLNNLRFSEPFSCTQSDSPIPLLDKKIRQFFTTARTENISAISLKLATYTKVINSVIQFKILDENKNITFSKEIHTLLLEDNRFFDIKIGDGLLEKNKKYYIELSYKKTPTAPIGFWNSNKDCYKGSLVVGSDEIWDSDLVMHLKYSKGNFFANAKELLDRMSQYKPLWLKSGNFLLLLTTYFLVTILLLFLFIRRVF